MFLPYSERNTCPAESCKRPATIKTSKAGLLQPEASAGALDVSTAAVRELLRAAVSMSRAQNWLKRHRITGKYQLTSILSTVRLLFRRLEETCHPKSEVSDQVVAPDKKVQI